MTLEKLTSSAKLVLNIVAVIGAVIAFIGAMVLANTQTHVMTQHNGDAIYRSYDMLGLLGGIALVVVGLLLLGGGVLAGPFISLAARRAIDDRWRYEQLMGALENQRQVLESVRDSVTLSDAAKQVAYRHKDREALRNAIREDLEKQDYGAASSMVDEMERRFGYHEEAVMLREQIETARRTATESKVRESMDKIEEMLAQFDWASATREAEKLVRRFPERPELKKVHEKILASHDNHKRELLKSWKDSVARDDVDRSVELLRQLDAYLTPNEAEAYKEIARDVFKKKLQQLGVQFALHVHDKNWNEALRIGQQINDEFPNTRIAAEVKERMTILKEKAMIPAGV